VLLGSGPLGAVVLDDERLAVGLVHVGLEEVLVTEAFIAVLAEWLVGEGRRHVLLGLAD